MACNPSPHVTSLFPRKKTMEPSTWHWRFLQKSESKCQMVPPSKQDRVASATLTMENPRGTFGDTDVSHLNLHL